ncbi:MAG TPA: hypothetical protein VJ672_04830 [Gemmatimonadaceae bacterium]|nr:hypothetical protein [Gemmatimonadaceae bacterium]
MMQCIEPRRTRRTRRMRRWSRIARVLAAVAMAATIASCSDSTGPEECLTNLTLQINVFVDPEPRFEWVPRCLISELAVFDENTAELKWTLFSSGGERPNTIRSGAVYGVVPPDAEQDGAPQPLIPGTTYRVSLSATFEGEVSVIGTRTFVR